MKGMKSKKAFLFRFDADEVAGMGHFNRCFAFARRMMEAEADVILMAKHIHPNIEVRLLDSELKYVRIPDDVRWADEADFISQHVSGDISNLILDIATEYAFHDLEGVAAYISGLKELGQTVLIDGMSDNALAPKITAAVHVVVVPYFGADDMGLAMNKKSMYLIGPKYYIFPQEYHNGRCVRRNIRENANRVLITLGGADPLGITLKTLKALSGINGLNLEVRVVIGPNFQSEHVEEIRHLAASSENSITMIDRPESLIEHMLWCDVAVTSSGSTKYELAVTGTPGVQIALNEDHARINEYFVRHGSMKLLGIDTDVGVDRITSEVKGLLDNFEERNFMSRCGQELLDVHGVNRIIETAGVGT
jgi:spore coat polysaccharide biosynthesis predicted glycosyltransferase SpsG